MFSSSSRLLAICVATVASLSFAAAQAQQYPNKPIRIIVPLASGSGSDNNSRYFAEKMGPILGQPVIVENRPGGDSAIGMVLTKSAPADGYTIVQGSISPSAVNVVVKKDLGYDPVKDFKPLFGYSRAMSVVAVSNDSSVKTLAELLAAGKKGGVPLSVGTFSTAHRLAAARMGNLSGQAFNDVPYKGQSQVQTDLIGNNLDFAFLDLSGAYALIRSHKIRALAVTGETRHPDFPEIPAVNETKGLETYSQYAWNAFFIRKEVPDAIQAKLSDAVQRVMTSPEAIESFYKPKGTQAMAVPAEAVKAMQVRDIQEFRKIFDALGLKPE